MAIVAEVEGQVGPSVLYDGANAPLRQDRAGSLVISQAGARFYEPTYRKQTFHARAIVTSPVIFSTAAGTGGPLLYNGSTTVNLVVVKASWASLTVNTTATILGLTGGPTTAPGSQTAIDTQTSGFLGAAASQATAMRIGTPSAAGTFFYPLVSEGGTVAESSQQHGPQGLLDLDGLFIVPPGFFISWAASATGTSNVYNLGLSWIEVPV